MGHRHDRIWAQITCCLVADRVTIATRTMYGSDIAALFYPVRARMRDRAIVDAAYLQVHTALEGLV